MALISIGSAGNMVKQGVSALGSNAITNALGIDFGSILSPSKFLTKFTPSSIFAYRSLAYELKSAKNFDVIFHWFPKCSQIRSMISNAFSAQDTDELNLLIDEIQLPAIVNEPSDSKQQMNPKFSCAAAGLGVHGSSTFNMRFLATEFSYVAHCFYQWLSETESPFWVYGPSIMMNKLVDNVNMYKELTKSMHVNGSGTADLNTISAEIEADNLSKLIYLRSQSESAPFTRADIEVKYYSANMKELHSVWFMGAFPISIQLENLNNTERQEFATENVTFTYDSVCISTPFTFTKADESKSNITGSITNSVNSAFGGILGGSGNSNSAAWTAGLYDDTLSQIGNTYLSKLSRKLNKITNKAGEKVSGKIQSLQKSLTA